MLLGTQAAARRHVFLTLSVMTTAWVALSCSHEPKHPPNLPMASIYKKSCSRLEVSELVVGDPERRARVKEIYDEIATRVERLQLHRASSNFRLLELSRADALDEAAVREEMNRVKLDTERALAHYVDLQMELREQLTEKEFLKLGKFN